MQKDVFDPRYGHARLISAVCSYGFMLHVVAIPTKVPIHTIRVDCVVCMCNINLIKNAFNWNVFCTDSIMQKIKVQI